MLRVFKNGRQEKATPWGRTEGSGPMYFEEHWTGTPKATHSDRVAKGTANEV